MFTGLIEECGTLIAVSPSPLSSRLTITGSRIFHDLSLGDSVAVDGVCLTASHIEGNTFSADVMQETLRRSTLGLLKPGGRVNLERAMPASGRFGGHIVSGHIDGTGTLKEKKQVGNATLLRIDAPPKLLRYIVEKGSIAMDGVSLTVVSVDGTGFSVSMIPHTGMVTTLPEKRVGDAVNLENDLIGKYVERMLAPAEDVPRSSGLTMEYLTGHGF